MNANTVSDGITQAVENYDLKVKVSLDEIHVFSCAAAIMGSKSVEEYLVSCGHEVASIVRMNPGLVRKTFWQRIQGLFCRKREVTTTLTLSNQEESK